MIFTLDINKYFGTKLGMLMTQQHISNLVASLENRDLMGYPGGYSNLSILYLACDADTGVMKRTYATPVAYNTTIHLLSTSITNYY